MAHYIKVTGDAGILKEEVPFLEGPELKDGEKEHMFIPAVSTHTAPLAEHCVRALDRAWRLGAHGPPIIRDQRDWNDGMNLVGAEGRGESIWLAWFLCAVFEAFADVMETAGTAPEFLALWRQRRMALASAVDRYCWDGDWYLRGFFDNGEPLGSHANSEARIDSLAQSWAVLSGMATPDWASCAMESAEALLADLRNIELALCLLLRLTTPCRIRATLWDIRPAFAKTGANTRTARLDAARLGRGWITATRRCVYSPSQVEIRWNTLGILKWWSGIAVSPMFRPEMFTRHRKEWDSAAGRGIAALPPGCTGSGLGDVLGFPADAATLLHSRLRSRQNGWVRDSLSPPLYHLRN